MYELIKSTWTRSKPQKDGLCIVINGGMILLYNTLCQEVYKGIITMNIKITVNLKFKINNFNSIR